MPNDMYKKELISNRNVMMTDISQFLSLLPKEIEFFLLHAKEKDVVMQYTAIGDSGYVMRVFDRAEFALAWLKQDKDYKDWTCSKINADTLLKIVEKIGEVPDKRIGDHIEIFFQGKEGSKTFDALLRCINDQQA